MFTLRLLRSLHRGYFRSCFRRDGRTVCFKPDSHNTADARNADASKQSRRVADAKRIHDYSTPPMTKKWNPNVFSSSVVVFFVWGSASLPLSPFLSLLSPFPFPYPPPDPSLPFLLSPSSNLLSPFTSPLPESGRSGAPPRK